VILEPVVGNAGFIVPDAGFLEGLRELTKEYGALLMFDEVMTGFRIAYGGAQEKFGITPDLPTLAKLSAVGCQWGLTAVGPILWRWWLRPARCTKREPYPATLWP